MCVYECVCLYFLLHSCGRPTELHSVRLSLELDNRVIQTNDLSARKGAQRENAWLISFLQCCKFYLFDFKVLRS